MATEDAAVGVLRRVLPAGHACRTTTDLQSLELDPVDTTQIRLSVVDAYPPSPDQPIDEVAITDIRVFTRP